ncbi:MAG: hypothetical protein ACYDBH_19435 [Acidobacteriaceae bacterium]
MRSRMAFTSLLLIALSIAGQGVAVAGQSYAQFVKTWGYTGATFSTKNIRGVTTLDIRINETKFLAAIPVLQQIGVLNPDLNQTAINLMPVALSSIAAETISGLAVMTMYQDPRLDRLQVNSYLQVPDNYGHMKSHLMHSFSFNRKLYSRIDWKNFQTTNLPRVAPGFKYGQWVLNKADAEMGQ